MIFEKENQNRPLYSIHTLVIKEYLVMESYRFKFIYIYTYK